MTSKLPPTTGIANYYAVIVTPSREGPLVVPRARLPRDPAAVQAESRRPRRGHALESLLDQVVAALVEDGRPGTAALEIAGRAAVGTSWPGYRNGRNRVATLAATYLRWLAPREGWAHVGTLEV